MARGELGAVFKGLAKDAGEAAGKITESMARLAEQTADIEERNVAKLLELDAKAADEIASVPARVRGPNPGMEPVVIKVERKPFMPKYEFGRKMDALKKLGEDGKLYKAPNPVARDDSVTAGYRQNLIDRIHAQYHQRNPDFARTLIRRITGNRMHPDHIWELQLGGPDEVGNLRFLHAKTNTDIGNQIWQQIRTLPDGTPIRIEVVH